MERIFLTTYNTELMKRLILSLLVVASATVARAQIPVVDVASLAQAAATVIELRNQVDLLLKEVALAEEIRHNAESHLRRYERALAKRGIIPSKSLGTQVDHIQQAYQVPGSITWSNPGALEDAFLMYEDPPNPLQSQRDADEKTMATMQGTLASLQAHSASLAQAHEELERFKTEIQRAKEPQQMRDVQANLQIMHARELLLNRQALMTLTNMEAVRAADAVSQEAQERMRYDAFVGGAEWLGNPNQYRVKRFLKMPNHP